MSKILLLDTNFSALPIYDFLNDNNEVYVIGGNPNDFLAKSVKNYLNIDYSDIEKVRAIIEKLKVDFIVPGGNDRSYQICTLLNSEGRFPGLDSVEVTETILNKEKFRSFATRINLPVPRIITPEMVGKIWPIIIKPVDAYSGRGITIIDRDEQGLMQIAIDRAKEFSRTKTMMIEEYITGQLYSHTAFITKGSVILDFIVEEHGTANPFVVDTSRLVYDFPDKMIIKIRKEICRMAKELDLVDGLVHTQFIKQDDSFWIIEITRRCPGDLYSMLIEISTGYKYGEAYSKPFLNQKLTLPDKSLKKANILRHTISQTKEGYLSSIKFNIPVNIEKFVPISLAGDFIKASPFGRIGLLFLSANSRNELNSIFDITLKRELYTIQ